MHTFQLVDRDGRDLGTVDLARPDWPAGSVIYRGAPEGNLRVVEVRSSDDGLVLVVEESGASQ
jgi:hypothetical protein